MISEPIRYCTPEEVLFKSESGQSREEIAALLRRVADNLKNGDAVTLEAGSESVTLELPARSTFEIKAKRGGPANGPDELNIESELEWDEGGSDGGGGNGPLEIE